MFATSLKVPLVRHQGEHRFCMISENTLVPRFPSSFPSAQDESFLKKQQKETLRRRKERRTPPQCIGSIQDTWCKLEGFNVQCELRWWRMGVSEGYIMFHFWVTDCCGRLLNFQWVKRIKLSSLTLVVTLVPLTSLGFLLPLARVSFTLCDPFSKCIKYPSLQLPYFSLLDLASRWRLFILLLTASHFPLTVFHLPIQPLLLHDRPLSSTGSS